MEDSLEMNSEEEPDGEPMNTEFENCLLGPKYTAKSGIQWESRPYPATRKRRQRNIINTRPELKYSENASTFSDF